MKFRSQPATHSLPAPPGLFRANIWGILLSYLLIGLTNLPILIALSILKIKTNLIFYKSARTYISEPDHNVYLCKSIASDLSLP